MGKGGYMYFVSCEKPKIVMVWCVFLELEALNPMGVSVKMVQKYLSDNGFSTDDRPPFSEKQLEEIFSDLKKRHMVSRFNESYSPTNDGVGNIINHAISLAGDTTSKTGRKIVAECFEKLREAIGVRCGVLQPESDITS